VTTLATPSLAELRMRLAGDVHEPGAPEYDDACALFNSMIERRPLAVARCSAPDDVVAALAFARDHGLPITVRAGGHGVAGLALNDGGLVLDVRPMCEIEVDPVARRAKVGGGATWAQLDAATQAHGLATTGGRVSTTGVVGLTLGGGSGWLERRYGLACDNVEAVELVTADGRLVRASADENPELLWALRGGGGNFGVVTSIEFRLHPVGPQVFGGIVMHPAERGRELMRAWRAVMADAPEELSLAFAYLTAPDEPEIPAELRGKLTAIVGGMHCGSLAEGERLLRPIRELGTPALDVFGPTAYTDFQCSLDDPPGKRNYWTVEHLAELPEEAVELIHEHALEMPGSAPQIFCVAWGGAVARADESTGPLAGRDARFIVHPLMMWDDPADDERVTAWGRTFRDALAPLASGAAYPNFEGEEGTKRARAGYTPASVARLAAIKAKWDPGDVFRASGHVPPAAS
jgi:FAD/FMN-containing dehydrogenase